MISEISNALSTGDYIRRSAARALISEISNALSTGDYIRRSAARAFARIPDAVIIGIQSHIEAGEFDGMLGDRCYCGWAVREAVTQGIADTIGTTIFTDKRAAEIFGGDPNDWVCVYGGAAATIASPAVAEAFEHRLLEARARVADRPVGLLPVEQPEPISQ